MAEIVREFRVRVTFDAYGKYYWDCDTAICEVCAINLAWRGFEEWTEPLAILSGNETDSPNHCSECGDMIDENLTSYGVNYVTESLREYVRGYLREKRGETTYRGNAEVLDQWASALDGYSLSIMQETYLSAFHAVRHEETK